MFIAPCDVVLSDTDVVQPDLLFVSRAREHLLGGGDNVRGAPDLVIEILSPATADRDRGYKRALYARHGVAEYWLVDPAAVGSNRSGRDLPEPSSLPSRAFMARVQGRALGPRPFEAGRGLRRSPPHAPVGGGPGPARFGSRRARGSSRRSLGLRLSLGRIRGDSVNLPPGVADGVLAALGSSCGWERDAGPCP